MSAGLKGGGDSSGPPTAGPCAWPLAWQVTEYGAFRGIGVALGRNGILAPLREGAMATASDYVPAAIRRALGDDVPVDAVRVSEATKRALEASRTVVSVVWRLAGVRGSHMLDGTAVEEVEVDIECRASQAMYARRMADRVLAEMGANVIRLGNRYDEVDDEAQQEVGVYSHIVEVALPPEGL